MSLLPENPLSICMFSNLFPPIASGSSMFTWSLARHLVKRGHRVIVVAAQVDSTIQNEINEGVQVFRLPAIQLPRMSIAHNFKWMTYTFTPQNLIWLKKLCAKEKFHVIHQQNHIFDTILSSSLLARQFKLPLILTVHTCAEHPNPLLNALLTGLDAIARQVIVNKADVVVSPGSGSKEYVETRHRITYSPIIPYGIELSRPAAEDIHYFSQQFGLADGPVILSLGHVNRFRDRLDLIEAMVFVLQKFPSARLLITGEVYVQEPVQLVRRLGVEDHITFTGAVPHHQIPALFALSALEAHTANTAYPGPGIASMEAMAAGLPVVTMEVDSRSSFNLHNWENVVMVPPHKPQAMADATIRLLSDANLRKRIGRNARRMIAECYSWDAVSEAYITLYHQVIEQHIRQKAGQM